MRCAPARSSPRGSRGRALEGSRTRRCPRGSRAACDRPRPRRAPRRARTRGARATPTRDEDATATSSPGELEVASRGGRARGTCASSSRARGTWARGRGAAGRTPSQARRVPLVLVGPQRETAPRAEVHAQREDERALFVERARGADVLFAHEDGEEVGRHLLAALRARPRAHDGAFACFVSPSSTRTTLPCLSYTVTSLGPLRRSARRSAYESAMAGLCDMPPTTRRSTRKTDALPRALCANCTPTRPLTGCPPISCAARRM